MSQGPTPSAVSIRKPLVGLSGGVNRREGYARRAAGTSKLGIVIKTVDERRLSARSMKRGFA